MLNLFYFPTTNVVPRITADAPKMPPCGLIGAKWISMPGGFRSAPALSSPVHLTDPNSAASRRGKAGDSMVSPSTTIQKEGDGASCAEAEVINAKVETNRSRRAVMGQK
jgi:hypothetical protein